MNFTIPASDVTGHLPDWVFIPFEDIGLVKGVPIGPL